MNLPLSGVTLLEATSLECPLALRLTVAFAGRLAGALGATVIRFEQESGDPIQAIPPHIGEESALSVFLNAGKRLVPWRGPASLSPELQGHVDSADIVLLDRGSVELAARPASRVTALVSFFADRPSAPSHASEFTVLALSGVLDTVGDPKREPLRLGGHQLAYSAGLSVYAGITAAYFATTRESSASPASETVRVNLFDVAMWLNWKNLAAAAAYGTSPTRAGESHQWQILRCRDGWVALVFMEKDWAALQDLVGDDRLGDPRFASEAGRGLHAGALGDIVEQHFLNMSRGEIEAAARAKRLPLGAVWSPIDLVEDPHYLARGFLRPARTRAGEIYLQPALPVRWHGLDAAATPSRTSLR
jgi:crotonobetainyl-CoA:carnitine CoA-transferase CaiB-like acyl-CoA transferase